MVRGETASLGVPQVPYRVAVARRACPSGPPKCIAYNSRVAVAHLCCWLAGSLLGGGYFLASAWQVAGWWLLAAGERLAVGWWLDGTQLSSS